MRRKIFLLALALWMCPSQEIVYGQSQPFDDFIGSWRGKGTLFGRPADFEMTWERRLGDRFVHLTFGNGAITAQAFYHATAQGSHQGTWFDSRGVTQPLRATFKDGVLETHWGAPETEQGRTRYRLVGPDAIEVTDEVLRDGQWAQFGQARYSRKSGPLDGMRWLLGQWRRETERSITVESWRQLSERTFEGQSARISKASGDTVFTESLRLLEMEGVVFYLPKVAENTYPIPFKRVSSADKRTVFENRNHDFPQQIVYERKEDGSMTATTGGESGGEWRTIVFEFKRIN